MPTIDGKNVSPDEAMLLGRCPECGQPLIPKTARAHASDHWFGRDLNDPSLSEEGRRRYKLIIDFAAARYDPSADPDGTKSMPTMPFMSKTEPAVPTNDLAVFGFCELWGLIFGLPPGEDLYRGAPVTARMVTFLVIGGAFAILGPTWPSFKSRFPRRLSATFIRTASDFRWWVIALLFGLIGPALIRSRSDVVTMPPSAAVQVTTGQAAPVPSPPTLADQGLAFTLTFADHLKDDFLRLPRPCVMKILAPPKLENARGQLVSGAMNSFVQSLSGEIGPNSNIPPCTIPDEVADRHPEIYGHQNFPAVGIAIHTSDKNLEARKFLADVFRAQGIPVTGDSALPPGSPDNLIYIELGQKLR